MPRIHRKSGCETCLPALLLALLLAPTVGTAAESTTDDGALALEAEARVAASTDTTVSLHGRDLFRITRSAGALDPAERAAAIEERLRSVASGPASVLDDLRVEEHNGVSEIYAGQLLLRVVSPADAERTGRTRQQLAADQLLVVRSALEREFRDRSFLRLMRGVGLALAATLLFGVFVTALGRLSRWLQAQVTNAAWIQQLESRLTHLRMLWPGSVLTIARGLASGLIWIASLTGLFFYLGFALSQFPGTRGIAATMAHSAGAAMADVGNGIANYIPSLLNLAIIVVLSRFVLKLVRRLFEHVEAGRLTIAGFYPEWAMTTYSILRFLVIAIAAIMAFPYLPGSGSEGFKGISVFIGLLVSLGAASAIANMIAGIVITYMRPFRNGDVVKIADAMGTVLGKDLFVVRLRTIKNVDITIPNSLVLANHIINFSANAQGAGLILHTSVTIGYDAPWQQVHSLLLGAARRVDGILTEPAPYVLQTALNDFHVSYEINAYTNRPDQMPRLYSDIHARIQDAFNEAGVEILSPSYAAVRDGNAVARPDAYLPKGYVAPSFGFVSRVLAPRGRPEAGGGGG